MPNELDSLYQDMVSTEQRIEKVEAFIKQLKRANGVSGHDIVSLEAFHQKALSERPLAGFTQSRSKTNYQFALEGSIELSNALKVGLVTGFATLLAGFVLWLITGEKSEDGKDGKKGSKHRDIVEINAALETQADELARASEIFKKHLDELSHAINNPTSFEVISKAIIDQIKSESELLEGNLTGVHLYLVFDIMIGESILRGSRPLTLNLFKPHSADSIIIGKAREVIVSTYQTIQKDLTRLTEGFHSGTKPEHLTDTKTMETMLKALATACGVSGDTEKNGMGYARGISDYITKGLEPDPKNMKFNPVVFKDISTGGFGNILTPIKDLIAFEASIEDQADQFKKQSDDFTELVKNSQHSDTDKVFYQDAIQQLKNQIMVLAIIVGAFRKIERSLRAFEIAVTRGINKLIRVLKASIAAVDADTKLSDEHKHTGKVQITQLIQELNESKPIKRGA